MRKKLRAVDKKCCSRFSVCKINVCLSPVLEVKFFLYLSSVNNFVSCIHSSVLQILVHRKMFPSQFRATSIHISRAAACSNRRGEIHCIVSCPDLRLELKSHRES